MRPTPEGQIILNAARDTRRSFKISAFAGAGKTTLLTMIAKQRLQLRGLYISFNKSLQVEAKGKFPRSVLCMTSLALAFRAMNAFSIQHRLEGKGRGLYGRDIVEKLTGGKFSPTIGEFAKEAVLTFIRTTDPELTLDHVVEGQLPVYRQQILHVAQLLLADMCDWENGKLPIPHDFYLKAWQMTRPDLSGSFDYILFDEAQDADPVTKHIIENCQVPVIYVGDTHQSIYRFRGAVNAMDELQLDEYPLTMSFRFGRVIADVANRILEHKPAASRPKYVIMGNPAVESHLGQVNRDEKYAILSRTNAGAFDAALQLHGKKVHFIGGSEPVLKMIEAGYALFKGNPVPDNMPSIKQFQNWEQLKQYCEKHHDPEIKLIFRMISKRKDNIPDDLQVIRSRSVGAISEADVVISTAHKGKGLEFEQVILWSDFTPPYSERWDDLTEEEKIDELNLLYVAATRAKYRMQVNEAVFACLENPAPGMAADDRTPIEGVNLEDLRPRGGEPAGMEHTIGAPIFDEDEIIIGEEPRHLAMFGA